MKQRTYVSQMVCNIKNEFYDFEEELQHPKCWLSYQPQLKAKTIHFISTSFLSFHRTTSF